MKLILTTVDGTLFEITVLEQRDRLITIEVKITNYFSSLFNNFQVLLHTFFMPTRPLTVTAAYLKPNRDLIFHQMILDRVENDEYVLQNTLFSSEFATSQNLPLLRIDRQKHY